MKENRKGNWAALRWGATGIYVTVALVLAALTVLVPDGAGVFGIILGIWTAGALIPLFLVLILPYFRGKRESDGEGLIEKPLIKPKRPEEDQISDQVPVLMMVSLIIGVMVVVMAVVLAVPMARGETPVMETVLIIGITFTFLGLLLTFFHSLEVEVDRKKIRFHWGPFGKSIPITDIRSIRPVSVHPLRDFMGYGIRYGPGGEIGYISYSRFGVRIETVDGKKYVVSTNRPMKVTEMVRWAGRKKSG